MKEKNNVVLIETNKTEKLNNVEKYKTALKKVQFINELKSGLGDEIKKNPNNFKVYKKTWFQKFLINLKKIFTKF